jgi:hypothetical protein
MYMYFLVLCNIPQGIAGTDRSKDTPSEKTIKVKQKYDFAGEEVE